MVTPGLRILPFYIWVEEEADPGAQAGDHELRLLTEYRAREAVEAVQGQQKQKTKGSGGGDEELLSAVMSSFELVLSGGGDQYERSVRSHGDEYFHQFSSVIAANPGQVTNHSPSSGHVTQCSPPIGQVLRYDRQSGQGPLLLR